MWGFGEGIALRGLLANTRDDNDSGHREFVFQMLRRYASGNVGTKNEEHIAPGHELLTAYENTRDANLLDAAVRLATLHASFPRNKFGARMHRHDLPGWRQQIWVDCMDVDAPFLLKLAGITENESYIEQGTNEILGYCRALQEESGNDEGLFWHGYESNCGRNGQLWARGNGWALMGLIETLKQFPGNRHAEELELKERLQQLCEALQRYQHTDGLWHTVVTENDTYLESTLAVMVAFALREAFEAGLLDEALFGNMERKAREAAVKCINDRGELERVTDATPIGELKMYATRPFGIFPWGQGPLLLMLSQQAL